MNTEATGYLALIKGNRNFRSMWGGQIVSLLGDWFNLIASAALIAQLTESGFAIGGLFVVRMLAPFLITPFVGVIADRYNRKWILLLTDLFRGIVVLGFLLVRDASDVWMIYALTGLQLGIGAFFFTTRNAILPDIVSDSELGAANTISSTTWSTMLAIGAALGGLVAGAFGHQVAFIIDSATFFVSAIFIATIRYTMPKALANSDKSVAAAVKQYVEGLRYLRQNVDQLVTASIKGVNTILSSTGMQIIQIAIAGQIFVIGEGGGTGLGIIYGVAGIGTGLGPLVARAITGDNEKPLRHSITVGWILASIGMYLTSTLLNFPVILAGTFLRGFGGGIVWVMSTQLLLQKVPGDIRGRTFATEYMMFTLAGAIGAAGVGSLLDSSFGLAGTVQLMAITVLIPAALWFVWSFYQSRLKD